MQETGGHPGVVGCYVDFQLCDRGDACLHQGVVVRADPRALVVDVTREFLGQVRAGQSVRIVLRLDEAPYASETTVMGKLVRRDRPMVALVYPRRLERVRRAHPRVEAAIPLRWGDADSGPVTEATTFDLGGGGISFPAERRVTVGRPLRVVLDMGVPPVDCVVEVVACALDPATHAHVVRTRFTMIAERDRTRIVAEVARRRAEQARIAAAAEQEAAEAARRAALYGT